jgi:hypothetical protein
VLFVAGFILSLTLEYTLPPVLQDYLRAQAEAPLTLYHGLFYGFALLFFGAYVVATIGLYFFKSWSRRLYLISTAVGYLLTPFLGPIVEPAIATAINYLVSLIGGMILVVIYFTPLSSRFERADSLPTVDAVNP